MLTTIGWGIGGKITYCLEGSVFIGGAVVQWLRDGLGVIGSSAEVETLAGQVADTGDVYFVPAFVGMGAPYWDPYARGTIQGITRGTTAAHLARAALESMAYQTRDVLEAMQKDARIDLAALKVDGGASVNHLLMQFQADVLGVPVCRPEVAETTALGAAYLAGLAVGYWQDLDELTRNWAMRCEYLPQDGRPPSAMRNTAAGSRPWKGRCAGRSRIEEYGQQVRTSPPQFEGTPRPGRKSLCLATLVAGRGRKPQPFDAGGHRAGRGVVIAICCLLVLGTVVVFAQTVRHGFVNCDDNEYVYENVNIQRGLTPASAWWAITAAHSANWHPLTWMSHTIDWQVFGTWDADLHRYVGSWPGGHHLVNVLLHAVNAVLLFLVLQEMTGATWPSAVVAALFAIHPLRAESVAWVTSRKDMLSGLFFLLTLAAYQGYAARPFSWWRYALGGRQFRPGAHGQADVGDAAVRVALVGLLAVATDRPAANQRCAEDRFSRLLPPRVILEKIPLLALSAGSCLMTMWAQSLVAAFKPLELHFRVGNALLSYAAYIGQMFYPVGMVVHYPHPGPNLKLQHVLLPIAVLLSITLAVGCLGWRRRYLAVGWLWYLGMLVPVIGLVQVGAQARADRYTYLTQIGLYIMIAWGLSDLARAWRGRTALCMPPWPCRSSPCWPPSPGCRPRIGRTA